MIVLSSFVFSIVMVMLDLRDLEVPGEARRRVRRRADPRQHPARDRLDGDPDGDRPLRRHLLDWIVLNDIEAEASGPVMDGRRLRPAVRMALRLPRVRASPPTSFTSRSARQLESAPERARRPALLLGAGVGHQARPRPRLRPSRQRRDRQHGSRHPRRRGRLLGRLHRALRLRATPRCGRRSVVEPQAAFDKWAKDQTKIPDGNVSTGAAGGHGAGVFSDQITE